MFINFLRENINCPSELPITYSRIYIVIKKKKNPLSFTEKNRDSLYSEVFIDPTLQNKSKYRHWNYALISKKNLAKNMFLFFKICIKYSV